MQWNPEFNERIDEVAIGSLLRPVVTNFDMEIFKEQVLRTADKKPTHWFCYVCDTFVVWSHGKSHLDKFLTHLKLQHSKIQFKMELEVDSDETK